MLQSHSNGTAAAAYQSVALSEDFQPDEPALLAARRALRRKFASFQPDDEGHAQATALIYGDLLRYTDAIGWLWYTGTHWTTERAEAIVNRAITVTLINLRHVAIDEQSEAHIRAARGNRARVNGARNQLQDLLTISVEAFDAEPDKLNVRNGVIDLRTGSLASHHPSQLFTYCIPYAYEPQASWEVWREFLQEVVGGGEPVWDFLQTAVGYTLTGYTWEEKLFYLYGPTRSGKGTFSETLLELLGKPLSTGARFEMFTRDRSGDANNSDLAMLKAARLVTASESSRYSSLNPSVIKSITGGDRIFCALKFKNHFAYRPQFKLWLTSNWKVNTDVDDDAAWGRVIVIEFPNSHLGQEDKSLKRRLWEPHNMQGILTWAVQGAVRWFQSEGGLEPPGSVRETAAAHRAELDTLAQFIEDACEQDETYLCSNPELYSAYEEWCAQNGVAPKKHKSFSQGLLVKGYEKRRATYAKRLQRCWFGIRPKGVL